MTAPKLRFKEFDGDWNLSSLANISSIITGNTPSTSNREYYDGEFLFVSPVDIQENRYIKKTKTTLTANGFSKCRHIPENSVLFVCIGSTIGKVAQNKVICATNQQINAVIPQKGYSSDFLYLQLERLAPNIKLNAGVQAVPLINKTEFGKTLLNTPTFIEQTKIASFLFSVDEKISQLTEKHELLSKYKQGMMQKLFSQQLRFKADDGSEFGKWEEKNLVDISNIITGTTPETANKSFYNGSYLFVSPVDIQENRYISQTKTTLTESGFRKCRAIPKNSILFVCIGSTIGKVAQNKKICATNQQINAVIPNDEYCADYVYFQLLLQAQSIKLKAGTQAVPIINKTEFGKTTLLMPCLEEQIKIANFLSAIDQKIEVVAQQLKQAKQWKKGLLQQMFV